MVGLSPTPLVRLVEISKSHRNEIYAKLENTNPTGSHKDRESLSIIKDMVNQGFKEVVIASTGNAAISLSALAPCYGIRVNVFVSNRISKERLSMVSLFNPKLHLIDGSYDDAVEESEAFALRKGLYNANPGSNECKGLGDATIGEELSKQMREVHPDYVIIPSNNGTLLAGVWSGFKRPVSPRMIAATAKRSKLMGSIAGYHRFDAKEMDKAISQSGGQVIDITDAEAAKATRELKQEGVFCEPAAAASLAALKDLLVSDKIIVLVITGSAFKFRESYAKAISLGVQQTKV